MNKIDILKYLKKFETSGLYHSLTDLMEEHSVDEHGKEIAELINSMKEDELIRDKYDSDGFNDSSLITVGSPFKDEIQTKTTNPNPQMKYKITLTGLNYLKEIETL